MTSEPMTRPGQVLIVDDEPPIRALLTRWLTAWGYRLRAVGSASQALAGMPDFDGVWLARQVHERWPGTAIIMSTGRDDAETVRASRRAGAAAYVLKPFNPILLRAALDGSARS